MQSTVVRPRFVEPFGRTLARNAIIAVVVATVFALVQHRLWLIGPVALLALWFSLGGHYVDVIFPKRGAASHSCCTNDSKLSPNTHLDLRWHTTLLGHGGDGPCIAGACSLAGFLVEWWFNTDCC